MEWTDEMEDRTFTRVWVKTSGDHEGYTRRNVTVGVDKENFSPGHITRPGVVIHYGRMSCGGFIKLVGKLYLLNIRHGFEAGIRSRLALNRLF